MKLWHYALLVFFGGYCYGILSTFVKLAYAAGFTVTEVTGGHEFEMGGDATRELSLELVRELLERLDGVVEKSSAEQRKAMLQLVIGEITLVEGRKIGKVVLTLDEQLQNYFMKEGSSTNVVDESLSRSGAGKMRFPRLCIVI
jgi:hypothetical protein